MELDDSPSSNDPLINKDMNARYDNNNSNDETVLTIAHTPIDNDQKLLKLVLECFKNKTKDDNKDNDKELAILLTTGSLNPIHTGHADMMNFAKDELEKLDNGKYTVIGGFMSPSHDKYVSTKGSYIRSNNRVEMIKLAVADSRWIECDEWECTQDDFVDYPQVCEAFSKEINSQPFKKKICEYIRSNINNSNGNDVKMNENESKKKELNELVNDNNNNGEEKKREISMDAILDNMTIFYVCGRDHCDECHLWNGARDRYNGVVAKTLVVPRPDDKNNNNNNHRGNENCIVVNVPPQKMIDNRSSTQIRNSIKNSKGQFEKFQQIVTKEILNENVLEYIESNWDDLYKQLKDKWCQIYCGCCPIACWCC